MSSYVSHLSGRPDGSKPDATTCGEPWQGWQQPAGAREWQEPLPPHEQPNQGDKIRFCGACQKIVREGL